MRKVLLVLLLLCLRVSLQAQETPKFRCQQLDFAVSESNGTATLIVERTSGFDVPATGRLTVYPQTGGIEWVAMFELPFAPGVTSRSAEWAIDDAFYSGTRKFQVLCDGWTGSVAPPPSARSSVWLTINEDEPFPSVTGGPFQITEGETKQVTLAITPPFADGATVGIVSLDGTAVAGDDYKQLNYATTAIAKSGNLSVELKAIGDDVPEADEGFRIEIWRQNRGNVIGEIVVTVADDDRPPFSFFLDRERYELHEDRPGSVTVTRIGDPRPATAVLRFSSPGHIGWPADVSVEFELGQTSKTVLVPFDDAWYTADRIGTMTVLAGGFPTDTAEVVVVENDPLPVLSISDVRVREGAAGETTRADVQVTLSHPAGLDVHFDVTTADGTATGGDYTPLRKSLVFAPGSMSATARVNITGDGAVEPEETFTVSIGKCCGKEANLGRRTATVTIVDDDGPDGGGGPGGGSGEYRFAEPLVSDWSEDAKWLSATVVRGNPGAPATVTVRLVLDEARQFWPVTLRFHANEARKKVRFFIDDHYYSGNTAGRLELLDGTAVEDQRAVRIVDNENRPEVSVRDLEVTEGEGNQFAAFVVTVDPPSFLPIRVTLACHPGKQEPDVVIPGQTAITIPSLVTSVSVPFTIVGDDLDEPDEEVVAALWFFEPTHAEYGDRVATCTIRDDDRANARFSILADRLARGGSTTARLILGDAAVGATTIHLSSSEGLDVPESVQVPAGATRVEFPVTGVALGEGFIRAELAGGAAVEQRLLVYTAGALSLPPAIRMNRGGAIEVPLQLAAAEEQPFTVSITSSDAKIAAPPMFATIPGAFTLYGVANGQATLTITLPPELGGASVLLAVEVVDPVSKRRSLR